MLSVLTRCFKIPTAKQRSSYITAHRYASKKNTSQRYVAWPDQNTTFRSRNEWWGKEAGSSSPIVADPQHATYRSLRENSMEGIKKLPEWEQKEILREQIKTGTCSPPPVLPQYSFTDTGMTKEDVSVVIKAGIATLLLHVESRIAAFIGHGFYTIGPGGEELTSVLGALCGSKDALALHYRHLSTQIARQLKSGRSIEDIMLDRARAHVVSSLDPVTGGAHCAIGGGPYDFLVTSTLASQAPPAVGRALGSGLAHTLRVPCLLSRDSISIVTVGDGSINHAHFLSAVNMAEYATHRGYKCPIVFGISDNSLCISLEGYEWLTKKWIKKLLMPVFRARADHVTDMWVATKEALDYSRKNGKPCALLYTDVPRRFGHAATDRQNAYLTEEKINSLAARNPLSNALNELVAAGVFTWPEILTIFEDYEAKILQAFEKAVVEPKIRTRDEVLSRVSAPWAPINVKSEINKSKDINTTVIPVANTIEDKDIKQVMRKHMTAVYEELMTKYPQMVYIGEDVVHGGYYLVTDGIAKKFPLRIQDFPPEETCIIGAGMGFAQVGLLPVVEIPYAKYLDCGGDMYFEAALMNWLSNGKQPNGMIIRLQGFGKGVFGGNFHTHNILHIPPGVDVVCYSNGPDYARGLRYAVHQALAGRIVMTVDCTNLLNLRHLHGNDSGWMFPLTSSDEISPFDTITNYTSEGDILSIPGTSQDADSAGITSGRLAIVAYGNTVISALQAQKILQEELNISGVSVIDSPYLSEVPQTLKAILPKFSSVVFADDCKEGQQPFASAVCSLQNEGILPAKWRCISAQKTYNPLGSTLTFTSTKDIVEAALTLVKKGKVNK